MRHPAQSFKCPKRSPKFQVSVFKFRVLSLEREAASRNSDQRQLELHDERLSRGFGWTWVDKLSGFCDDGHGPYVVERRLDDSERENCPVER